jgi:fimbrial chaperone protein
VAPSFGPRFAIRQSIPVFFTNSTAIPRLSWDAKIVKGRLIVTARNDGGKRVRISALSIKDASGQSLIYGDGFIGYAFAGSSEGWASPPLPKSFAADGTIMISAQSDNGPVKATAKIHAAD